jgi:hypothetical protein
MANQVKINFLSELRKRYGQVKVLTGSFSLFEVGDHAARIYVRYSRVHAERRTFYGLRKDDLNQLEGYPSVIVFLWDSQTEPLFVVFAEYEELLNSMLPAKDGQYKVQVYLSEEATELYIANAGRFNVEGNFGWEVLDRLVEKNKLTTIPSLSHSQVQTLLGFIGMKKGFDIWIPSNDRINLDWACGEKFPLRETRFGFSSLQNIIEEVDVIWVQKGSNEIRALFEVEHTTPIYSGLLRFNDIHLAGQGLNPRFTVVANEERRALFSRQINRPTFQLSGIGKLCTFLEYSDVYGWFRRLYPIRDDVPGP